MTDCHRESQSTAAWQRAADAAYSLLVLEAVRMPQAAHVEIDRRRCEEVLEQALQLGVVPRPNALGRYVAERAEINAPLDPERDLAGLQPRRGDPVKLRPR